MKRFAKALVLALGLLWLAGCGTPPEATPTIPAATSTPTAEAGYPIPERARPTADPNYPAPQAEPLEANPAYPEPEE
jgi:uncharacterized lipoprotein